MKNFIWIFLIIFFNITPSNGKTELNFFEKGKSFFNEKKFDLAKFKFEQDIVFNPKSEKAYLYLAKIYNIKKNDDLEESNLKTVILLNPKNEEAVLDLTLLKIRKSNYSESEELIKNFEKICNSLCPRRLELQKKLDNIIKK